MEQEKKFRGFVLGKGIVSLLLAGVCVALAVWFLSFFNMEATAAVLIVVGLFVLSALYVAFGVWQIVRFGRGAAIELKGETRFLHFFLLGGLLGGAVAWLFKPTRRFFEGLVGFGRSCFKGVASILLLGLPVWLICSLSSRLSRGSYFVSMRSYSWSGLLFM